MVEGKSKALGKSPLEDHPEYVRAIGMISVENANLEHSLATLFCRVAFISLGIGHAIYLTPKSSLARIEILEKATKVALAPYGHEPHRKKLKSASIRVEAIIKRAKKLIGKRHGIIHDAWGVSKETGDVQRYVLGFPQRKSPIKIAELERTVSEFRDLIGEVRALSREFKAHPPRLVDLGEPS